MVFFLLSTKRFETWNADRLYSVSQNLRFSNPNNMKGRHDDVIIVFSPSVYKTCQGQPTIYRSEGFNESYPKM